VTLARLDDIPTPAHGNEEPFVLFNKIYHIVILSHNSLSQWLWRGAWERGTLCFI